VEFYWNSSQIDVSYKYFEFTTGVWRPALILNNKTSSQVPYGYKTYKINADGTYTLDATNELTLSANVQGQQFAVGCDDKNGYNTFRWLASTQDIKDISGTIVVRGMTIMPDSEAIYAIQNKLNGKEILDTNPYTLFLKYDLPYYCFSGDSVNQWIHVKIDGNETELSKLYTFTESQAWAIERPSHGIFNVDTGRIFGEWEKTYRPEMFASGKKWSIGTHTIEVTCNYTLQGVEKSWVDMDTFTIVSGFVDANGDGVDDRTGTTPTSPISDTDIDSYNGPPQRTDYADGVIGSVEYGFAMLMYYIEYPFRKIGEILGDLANTFSTSFVWVNSFGEFIGNIFGFLPDEVLTLIKVAFICATIALIYHVFRGH
jgi:hypothetical protein